MTSEDAEMKINCFRKPEAQLLEVRGASQCGDVVRAMGSSPLPAPRPLHRRRGPWVTAWLLRSSPHTQTPRQKKVLPPRPIFLLGMSPPFPDGTEDSHSPLVGQFGVPGFFLHQLLESGVK